jgi:hypothetical protein
MDRSPFSSAGSGTPKFQAVLNPELIKFCGLKIGVATSKLVLNMKSMNWVFIYLYLAIIYPRLYLPINHVGTMGHHSKCHIFSDIHPGSMGISGS